MSTTIDHAGRIVIPKHVRDRVGLTEGGAVEVVENNGVIEITPQPLDAQIVTTTDGPVLRAMSATEPLTNETVRGVNESLRR